MFFVLMDIYILKSYDLKFYSKIEKKINLKKQDLNFELNV